jgi:hypothetical protein
MGHIDGQTVSGEGRIPFVVGASGENWPWVRLTVGVKKITDTSLTGLGRPWTGLHTIDTIRRDAAEKGMAFSTGQMADESKVEVTVEHGSTKVGYTIDMEGDVIERIGFSGVHTGEVVFEYLADVDGPGGESRAPKEPERRDAVSWLLEAAGTQNE